MKQPLLIGTFLTLLAASALADAPAVDYEPAPEATVSFEAVGKPSLLKIKGHGARLSGRLSLATGNAGGKFEVDLDQFDTGIDLRNRHMKEKYLETAKFPKAALELESVELAKDWRPGTDIADAKFKGRLTLKGVNKPIEGRLKVTGPAMATEADFSLSLREFPLGVPSYMGVTVADAVNIHVAIPSFVRK